MTDTPLVLFVCVHNAGRSQMAAGWLRRLAGDRVEVRSAGSQPADQLNPVAVEAMREVGIDIAGNQPRILSDDEVSRASVVVTMGCGDACPYFPGVRYQDWQLADPAGQPLPVVRGIRDEIRQRVQALVDELQATGETVRIEAMTDAHADAVLAIYQAGIDEGNATFETAAPGWPAFTAARLPDHRFVALDDDGTVLGWVAATAWSGRCVYAGVVEHSVYVAPAARGRGVGRALLDALIASTEAAGVWTIQSGVFPENEASIALHCAAGFRVVGRQERLGCHRGIWRDVLLLERRSTVAGRQGPGRTEPG